MRQWTVCWGMGWALLACAPAWAVTELKFVVPSAATAETTRMHVGLMREFERAEPDVRITLVPLASWDEVIDTVRQRPAHDKAMVFVAEVSETLELEKLGLITPFEDAIQASKTFVAQLQPEFLGNSYCSDRKFCGPPFVRSTPVALYNLDHLRAAGLPTSPLPATWDELETLLERLSAKRAQPSFCLGGDWYDYLFEATVRAAGGSLFDERNNVTLATPEATTALQFWKRLRDRRLMLRSNTWKAALNGFVAGYCSVVYYSSGGMETVRNGARFAWMAEFLPRQKTYGVAVGGGNLYLASGMGPAEQQAAGKLVRFLYRPDINARISAATGFFPVLASAYNEPVLKARYAGDPAFARVREQLKYAHSKLMTIENLKVRNVIKRAIDRTLNDGVAPGAALQDAQREVHLLLGPHKASP